MTIADVLAECVAHGIAWEHPALDNQTRYCHAQVTLTNGWIVSIGCCDFHYCDHRTLLSGITDIYGVRMTPEEWFSIDNAEIAIFRPDGSWYIPEGEEGAPGGTWVGGWWSAERIWSTITYLATQ